MATQQKNAVRRRLSSSPSEQHRFLPQFFKRVFSPQALFEPLPAPVRLSLERNFSFFTKIFTQFIGA